MRQRTAFSAGRALLLFPTSRVAWVPMRTLGASEVAELLHEFGQQTAFRGGNPYRARAYTRAAENLLTLMEPLEDIVAKRLLSAYSGSSDLLS